LFVWLPRTIAVLANTWSHLMASSFTDKSAQPAAQTPLTPVIPQAGLPTRKRRRLGEAKHRV